jgi:hypothetical protein
MKNHRCGKFLVLAAAVCLLNLMPWWGLQPAQAFPPLTNVTAAVNPFSMRVAFEVYDPSRSQTMSGVEAGWWPINAFVHQDGIVAWIRVGADNSTELWYTTYDPGWGFWKTEKRSYAAYNESPAIDSLQIGGGVLVWRSQSPDGPQVHFASHDPQSGTWKSGSHAARPGDPGIRVAQGIVAFYRSNTGVVFFIYDPIFNNWHGDWIGGSFNDPDLADLSIQDFSVRIATSGIIGKNYILKYVHGMSPYWTESTSPPHATAPLAYFVIQPGDTYHTDKISSLRFWVTDMSIGVTNWIYIDDLEFTTVNFRSVCRIYKKPGAHSIRQEVTGPGGSDTTYNLLFFARATAAIQPLLMID